MPKFKKGDRVTKRCSAVVSLGFGTEYIGFTIVHGKVVGKPFEYKGKYLVPVSWKYDKRWTSPSLCREREIAMETTE